jgi:acyl carrier protein
METNDAALKERIKALIVHSTRLRIAPSEIGDDQPLVDPAAGLGLDSIDVLELVVGLEKSFGVTIPDRDTGQRVLRSVSTIAEFVKTAGRKS